MLKYKVTATIQSKTPGIDPVDMPWYRGDSPIAAMVSVGQNLENADSSHTRILAVKVEIIHPEEPWNA